MIRLMALVTLALLTGTANAQEGRAIGPNPPCSAFGTASGTCTQGNDARLGAGAVTGAIKGNGSNTFSQAASSDLSDSGVWSTFTPTILCGTGTVTSYSTQNGRYKVFLGKTIAISINVQVSNAGTCTGTLTVASLPVSSGSNVYMLSGRDNATGTAIYAFVASGATSAQVATAINTNPPATDTLWLSGIYETN